MEEQQCAGQFGTLTMLLRFRQKFPEDPATVVFNLSGHIWHFIPDNVVEGTKSEEVSKSAQRCMVKLMIPEAPSKRRIMGR